GGIIPQTGANTPDPEKVSKVYDRYEVIPVCKRFADAINSDPEIPKHLHMAFDLNLENSNL
ncbi:phage portal protein, partial [Vibrio fluvialis]|nr:phage portal protein [Vibrio fluvialis]